MEFCQETLMRTGHEKTGRPRLVVAYADSIHAARSSRHFRRQGWEVHQVDSAAEARRLIADLAPQLVVLDTELADESGWLLCAKLRLEHPQQRIILLCPELTPEQQRRSEFVGAAELMTREESVNALREEIHEVLVA